VQCAIEHYNLKGKPLNFAIADLLTIAYFFLLRPGKYTMPTSCSRTRTVQFHRKDVRFFKQGNILPHNTPLDELRTADAVRLYLDNQKNGQRGSTMHHTARPGSFCPVKALANRVPYLYTLAPHDDALPISLAALGIHVSPSHITLAVRESVVLLNSGYNPTRVSAHSLRASGAMALRLNKVGKDLIKKVGRWSSSTWLTYIHAQISSLTAGLSECMVIHHVFYNVGN
jgi:hypothetical protein